MHRGEMLTTRVLALMLAVSVLGSCESLHGAFAKLSGQMSITSDTLPNANYQQSYRAVLAAAGGTAPYRWSLADGWLPAGMKLQENGILAGTPEVPGEFAFTVQASDDARPSHSISKTFKLGVAAQGPAIITSKSELPWGRVGTDYQVKFTAWGGVSPYAWRSPDALPPGLKLQYDGTLSGKPAQAGDFGFAVEVSDLRRSSGRKFRVHISPAQTDPFGGVTALASPRRASGGWRVEKIGKRWVFVTPAGNAFWMIGIWGVPGDTRADERGGNYDQRTAAKYGNLPTQYLQANRRLRSWGFNVMGPWSYRMALPIDAEPEWGGTQPVKFPYILRGEDSSYPGRQRGLLRTFTPASIKRQGARSIAAPIFPMSSTLHGSAIRIASTLPTARLLISRGRPTSWARFPMRLII